MPISSQNSPTFPKGIPPNQTSGLGDIVPSYPEHTKCTKKNGSLDIPLKIESFKVWSSTAIKCTKQAFEEKLGTTSLTRDPEIEAKIQNLRLTQTKYQEICATVRKMISQVNALAQSEQTLSSQLTMVGQSQTELANDFLYNAEAQRVNALSSAEYAAALDPFCDGIDTFCKRTVPDVLETIRHLEQARLVYDAYRNEIDRLESKVGGTTTKTSPASTAPTGPADADGNIQQLRQQFATTQEAYFNLKCDIDVKMKLLHENRVRVIRKHLACLQAATFSFYSSGFRNLDHSLSAFIERNPPPGCTASDSYSSTNDESTFSRSLLEKAESPNHRSNNSENEKHSHNAASSIPAEDGVTRDVFRE